MHLIRTATWRVVTATGYSSSRNIDILKDKVATATVSTEDVIRFSTITRCAGDILEQEILDYDAIGRDPSWTAIEVVFLYIDSVDGDVGNLDVLVGDVGDEASGSGVCLYARSVLGIDHEAVLEL